MSSSWWLGHVWVKLTVQIEKGKAREGDLERELEAARRREEELEGDMAKMLEEVKPNPNQNTTNLNWIPP